MQRRISRSFAAHWLSRAESLVLVLIATVLVILAVLLLANSVIALVTAFLQGTVHDQAVNILDSVLLVMMTAEIVYTVTVSLEVRRLQAEPFLVIGAIAAIRRILVITAESASFAEKNPEAFRSTLIELGLLSFIVGVMAVSVYILRRSHTFVPEPEDEKEPE